MSRIYKQKAVVDIIDLWFSICFSPFRNQQRLFDVKAKHLRHNLASLSSVDLFHVKIQTEFYERVFCNMKFLRSSCLDLTLRKWNFVSFIKLSLVCSLDKTDGVLLLPGISHSTGQAWTISSFSFLNFQSEKGVSACRWLVNLSVQVFLIILVGAYAAVVVLNKH